jgi:hypothetical protein
MEKIFLSNVFLERKSEIEEINNDDYIEGCEEDFEMIAEDSPEDFVWHPSEKY